MPVLEYLEQQLWDLHLGTTPFHSEIYIGYRLLSLTEGHFIFQELACWLLGIYRHQEVSHGLVILFCFISLSCDNGLVMWLPMEWPSEREANGLVMARGSNKLLEQMVINRTLDTGVGMRGQLELLNMYKNIADTHPVSGPSLSVGDVLVLTLSPISWPWHLLSRFSQSAQFTAAQAATSWGCPGTLGSSG